MDGEELPVVEERLRVFEDVSGATSNSQRCFVHGDLKLGMEEVSHHAVGDERPFQLEHKKKPLQCSRNRHAHTCVSTRVCVCVCTLLLSRCKATLHSIISESS